MPQPLLINSQVANNQQISVRLANSNDLSAVVELRKQWHKNDSNFNVESEREFFALILECPSLGIVFIAENEQKNAVGMCTISLSPILDGDLYDYFIKNFFEKHSWNLNWFENHQDGRAVFVSELYTDESCRGKGIGKKLLQGLPQQFPLLQKIYLITGQENHNAVGFYTHLGFTKLQSSDPAQGDVSILFAIDTNKLK